MVESLSFLLTDNIVTNCTIFRVLRKLGCSLIASFITSAHLLCSSFRCVSSCLIITASLCSGHETAVIISYTERSIIIQGRGWTAALRGPSYRCCRRTGQEIRISSLSSIGAACLSIVVVWLPWGFCVIRRHVASTVVLIGGVRCRSGLRHSEPSIFSCTFRNYITAIARLIICSATIIWIFRWTGRHHIIIKAITAMRCCTQLAQ